jgi:hypothetical protein
MTINLDVLFNWRFSLNVLELMAGFQYFEAGPFLDRAILHVANGREASVRISFAF